MLHPTIAPSTHLMTSGLDYLIQAKRCEIADLAALTQTASLVDTTARLVHGLQRERGLSNLYLAPQGASVLAPLQAQIHHCRTQEDELRARYADLVVPTGVRGHGARLFNRVAYAIQGLDALAMLRDRVASRQWMAPQATAAYVKLIGSLLAVVFEAADSATDPDVSRLLVTLFNFMQGKELTGQERALGSALFASGQADLTAQQRWLHIVDAQTRCFQHSQQFASPGLMVGLTTPDASASVLADVERLRRVGCTTAPGQPLDTAHSPRWFELCTHRMDAMRAWEEHLVRALISLCEARMEAAQHDEAELSAWQRAHPNGTEGASDIAAANFFERATPSPSAQLGEQGTAATGSPLGPLLGKSLLDLVHEQNQRLQAMESELEQTRASLQERKLIERAKGLLMAHRNLNEEAAHKLMRQTAMDQGKKMHDVAQAILAMAHVLPLVGHTGN